MTHVGVDKVADVLNVTPRRIQQLAKKKGFPKPKRHGQYDALRCMSWYIQFLHGWKIADTDGSSEDFETFRFDVKG